MQFASSRSAYAAAFGLMACLGWAWADEPDPSSTGTVTPGVPGEAAAEPAKYSLKEARERALLMHEIYVATLEAMHSRYFHGDRAVVPARAMEDVFRDIEHRTGTQARWISASFTPMSITHEPKTDFEKEAARRLAKGEDGVEMVEAGFYRRAGAIELRGGCVSCHSGLFASTSTARKFAGLVISIPVEATTALTPPSVDPSVSAP
jgi:hypothetical protein